MCGVAAVMAGTSLGHLVASPPAPGKALSRAWGAEQLPQEPDNPALDLRSSVLLPGVFPVSLALAVRFLLSLTLLANSTSLLKRFWILEHVFRAGKVHRTGAAFTRLTGSVCRLTVTLQGCGDQQTPQSLRCPVR